MSTPRRYSDSKLEAMLSDVESDLVARKESLRGDAPSGIREAVCAFDAHPAPGQAGFVAYRNPLLAEAMRVLNLVQQWGGGIAHCAAGTTR